MYLENFNIWGGGDVNEALLDFMLFELPAHYLCLNIICGDNSMFILDIYG